MGESNYFMRWFPDFKKGFKISKTFYFSFTGYNASKQEIPNRIHKKQEDKKGVNHVREPETKDN